MRRKRRYYCRFLTFNQVASIRLRKTFLCELMAQGLNSIPLAASNPTCPHFYLLLIALFVATSLASILGQQIAEKIPCHCLV